MTAVHEVACGVHSLTLGRGAPASNVYLVRSGDRWVLVDAGWPSSAAQIRDVARSLYAGAPPAGIVLTHIHPDHSGAVGVLARSWGVPVYVHRRELPMAAGRYLPEFTMPLDRWVVMPVMRLLPRRTRTRVEDQGSITDVVRPLEPEGAIPVLPDWTWVATPGHTPGHVSVVRASDAVVITGDAAVTIDLNSWRGLLLRRAELAGPPRYTTWDWPEALRSLRVLADLEPRVVLPGHGRPLEGGSADALRGLSERRGAVRRVPRQL